MIDLTYRIWLIKSLARLFVPPLASVALALRVLDHAKSIRLHPAYQIALYVLSLLVYWTSWILLTRWDENRRAKKHGAKLPPIIEGKKLGNLDVLKRRVSCAFFFGYGRDLNNSDTGSARALQKIMWARSSTSSWMKLVSTPLGCPFSGLTGCAHFLFLFHPSMLTHSFTAHHPRP